MAKKVVSDNVVSMILDAATKTEKRKNYSRVDVIRHQEASIVLPDGMPPIKAAEWLLDYEKSQTQMVNATEEIRCYPLDGVVQLMRVIQEVYGIVSLQEIHSFFGTKPPLLVQVSTGPKENQFEVVPWGRMSFPGIEAPQYIETGLRVSSTGETFLVLRAYVMQRNVKIIQVVAQLVRDRVDVDSIYKGKTVKLDLTWLEPDTVNGYTPEERFSPIEHAPKFIDLSGVSEDGLILNPETEYSVSTCILSRLRMSEAVVNNGVPLSNGVLLAGPFGTGKTLTAMVTAKVANDNGWSFFYLEDARQLAIALPLVDSYSRDNEGVVLFVEDIDRIAEERDDLLNDILNMVDGASRKKNNSTMLVMTTNHPERINASLKRAGRISDMIWIGNPIGNTIWKFVELYGGSAISPDITAEQKQEAIEVMTGYSPAFIEATVNRAKLGAMSTHGRDITGKVDVQDILLSAKSYANHVEMASEIGSKELHRVTFTVTKDEANGVGHAGAAMIQAASAINA